MKIVILLGAPGSGKGTIAKRLSEGYSGFRHMSSGDLLRDAVKLRTAAGIAAEDYMRRGELVPDELVARMVSDLMTEAGGAGTLLLDGFPRTVAQAGMLDGAVAACGAALEAVVLLEVPEEVLVGRISGRRVCPACGAGFHVVTIPPKDAGFCDACGAGLVTRKDDDPATVENRLAVYRAQTLPLVDFYAARGLLRRVDGAKDADAVTDELRLLLA